MLSREQNELLIGVGPGTPSGELFRRYWLPVGVTAEIDDVPRRVRYLAEDLVLFRDDEGRPGLLWLHCPHRLTSLEFGRVECGGIRCIYHGWLFDIAGRCLEMPGEPEGSNFKDKVTHTAYPCRDHGGLVFAYMGPGEPPLLPNYEILVREDCTRHAGRDWMIHPCNYLQLIENDMDPVHAAIMHGDPALAQNHLFPNMPHKVIYEESGLGVQSTRYMDADSPDEVYRRQVNTFLPSLIGFGGGTSPDNEAMPEFGGAIRWRMPIDDDHTDFFRVYMIPHHDGSPIDYPPPRDMGGTRVPEPIVERIMATGKSWQPERGPDGHYVLDSTWAQDYVAIVSQGAATDRTRERLGASDRGVTMMRKTLFDAVKTVEAGGDPPGVMRDLDRNPLITLPRGNVILRGDEAKAVRRKLAAADRE